MGIDITDLHFDKLNFKKAYDPARERRAREIFRRGESIIDEVQQTGENAYDIFANVEGNYNDYHVKLHIEGGLINSYSCTCPDYISGNICKHILATSLEVICPHAASTIEGKRKIEEEYKRQLEEIKKKREEEAKRREYENKYYQLLNLIEGYKYKNRGNYFGNDNDVNLESLYEKSKLQKEIVEVKKINFEPKMEITSGNNINVSLKIGNGRMYVMKNIVEFYEAYKHEEVIKYGKAFSCIPKRENVEDKDKELFDLIIDYSKLVEYNDILNGDRYYGMRTVHNDMMLTGDMLDRFFEIMKDRTIKFVDPYLGEEQILIKDEKLDINITLKKNSDDEYEAFIDKANCYYAITDKKMYIIWSGELYIMDYDQNFIDVLEMFSFDRKFQIPNDKLNEFNTYIMPKIDKYIKKENSLEVPAKEGIFVNKLSSKVYLDEDEESNITMKLTFCYSDYEFNILDNDYHEYVKNNHIVRNVPEEEKIIKRIFMDGFEMPEEENYFIMRDEDKIYEFLLDKIEGYMNDFEVLVTEKFKAKKVQKVAIPNLSVKLDNGLLEVDISKININIDEIQNVLKNYDIKKKYYRLKNGDFLSLEQNESLDLLEDMENALDVNYDKIENGKIKLPLSRSMYLEKILGEDKKIHTTKNDNFVKIINNVENKNFSDDIKIDSDFENILRDYQKVGYKWLKVLEAYKLGGILADDMGLGKTLQIIAVLKNEIETENNTTSIVVSPSSLVLNWKVEIEKWCPKIKTLIIKGNAETRKELINQIENYDLVITSYDLLKRDISEYENKMFKYIIADEAQYIKNSSTQNSIALKQLQGEIKFALTGTPIENSLSELWSIFDFIMPGYLYNHTKFRKKFEIPILKDNDQNALKRLKQLISPFILRRLKQDVLTELPEKNIIVMTNEMTDEQENLYMAYLAQTKKEVQAELKEKGFEKSKFKILMLLTRLRQLCLHPSLFIENYHGGSGKLEQCMNLINDVIEAEHKILLFSSYTSMFEIIEKELNKNFIEYYKLTGNTPVDRRVEMVEEFNKNPDIKIFLISLKAGGTGLNLTGADVVIHFDPWWNVSSENQATDRAYRIGQKNSVQVYKLITNNSIEEKINKLQEKKAKISDDLLSTEETFISTFSKEEIMDLF